MDFDPNSFIVNGVSLMVLVFGLVEFIKSALGWDGKRVTVLAACLGVVLAVTYQLQTFLPVPYADIYKLVLTSVAFGLSASGYYKFAATRLPRQS